MAMTRIVWHNMAHGVVIIECRYQGWHRGAKRQMEPKPTRKANELGVPLEIQEYGKV